VTIRLKIICIVGAVAIAVSLSLALTFGILLKNNLENIAQRQTAEGAWQLRQQLDELLALGLPIDQILGFEEQCQALLAQKGDLAYAYISDRDGRILFHNDASLMGTLLAAPAASSGEEYISTVIPVNHGQETVGAIHVGIRYDIVLQNLVDAFKVPAAIFFLLLFGSIALSYALFEKFVGGPLLILTNGIDAFGHNPESTAAPIEMPSNDEFGTIASSFNGMAANIEANIARRKQAEADLVALNRDLETRIAERTAELAKSTDAALQATRAKSSFLSHMSHELRTPLNSIIGYAEAMQHRIKGELPDAYKEYADVIVKSGNMLLQTVNTVLDLAKIEAGRFELFPASVAMAEVIEDGLSVVEIQAKKRGVSLQDHADRLPLLHVDALRVKQAFVNIVGNAVKFTEHGTITIEDAYDSSGGYSLIVTDTGIGMTEEEVKIALEPFAQVNGGPHSRQFQGTGLGLSFSQEIMRIHGGDLRIRSARGQGTSVTLSFPAEAVLSDNTAEQPNPPLYQVCR
jgi:signal transduction histidine kinase